MRSRLCGGTNRLKGLCTTQEQAFTNRSEKKGQLWYLNPMDSGDNPTVNEILDKDKMTSISKPSYLDMPMVKSIASVYQTNRLKDATQFHHAAFNTKDMFSCP